MRLTPRQEVVLARLRSRDIERDGPETGAEMVAALWDTGRFTSYEQGQRTCAQLERKGLAVALGWGRNNARCYGPAPDTRER